MLRSNFKCNSHIEPYSNDAAKFGHQRKAEQDIRGIEEPHTATKHASLRISIKVHDGIWLQHSRTSRGRNKKFGAAASSTDRCLAVEL